MDFSGDAFEYDEYFADSLFLLYYYLESFLQIRIDCIIS